MDAKQPDSPSRMDTDTATEAHIEALQKRIDSFPDHFASLVISSVDRQGEPNPSYAPFVRHSSGALYIYISSLAKHTTNLYHTGKAGVMFIEDESSAEQIFARKRLTLHCQADLLERGSEEFEEVCDLFEQEFGEIFSFLRTMKDFRLFRLKSHSGLYVEGFGQAHRLDARGRILPADIRSAGSGPTNDANTTTANPHTVERDLE